MLYIFHVDRGNLISFNMDMSITLLKELATNRASKLKILIEERTGVPASKQVLMMSGGCCLENDSLRVNDLGTGTEKTNPIYLFSRQILEQDNYLLLFQDQAAHKLAPDLQPELDAAINMAPSYETVCHRVQLAQKLYNTSLEQFNDCERIVSDQHQQQQGWAAVSANLEDLLKDFQRKSDAFFKMHAVQQEKIAQHKKYLEKFKSNLELLQRIPVIPVLLNNPSEDQSDNILKLCEVVSDDESTTQGASSHKDTDTSMREPCDNTSNSSSSDEEEEPRISLLQWISAKDTQCTLDQVAGDSAQLIQELSETCINEWRKERDLALAYIQMYPRKNITGLSGRLFGLSQLMEQAAGLVAEQAHLARAFVQNQNRASHLGDVSILPDLCLSHQRQLTVMLKNYNDIVERKNRCLRAKEELCMNIHKRLQSVLKGEQHLLECDYKLSALSSKQKHLDYLLGVLDQIEHAPQMYLSAVVEVVRRRHFSQAFLTWASDLACHLTAIHNEELTRRTDFQADFEHHFLSSLFPGLNDLPPPYGAEPPPIFDLALPQLTLEDIQLVREKIPEIANQQKIPDFAGITQFFQSKTMTSVKFEERGVGDDRCIEDRLVQAVTDVGLGSITDRGLLKHNSDSQMSSHSCHLAHPHLREFDRGFESETDTEEFEKVGQSPIDLHFGNKSSSMENTSEERASKQDASTLTEDDLSTSKEEICQLKQALINAYGLVKMATSLLRDNMTSMNSDLQNQKDELAVHCVNISKRLEELQEGINNSENEKIHRLTIDHELELIDIKNLAISKDDEIRSLKLEKIESECIYNKRLEEISAKYLESDSKLKQYLINCEELQKQLELRQVEHEINVHEMQRAHQSELESLRSRFRLMTVTSMERSPSDTSLEHVERLDVIELVNHESILAEVKEIHGQQLKKAVEDAVKTTEARCMEQILVQKTRYDDDLNTFMCDAVTKLRQDKDKQIEILVERETALSRECRKYRDVITQLTLDVEDRLSEQQSVEPLLAKIDALEQDKCQLEVELSMERSKLLMVSHPGSSSEPPSMGFSMVQTVPRPCTLMENHVEKCNASTSTDNQVHRMLSNTQRSIIQRYQINIKSCQAGDRVLIEWDRNFSIYCLVLDFNSIHVLMADCISELGLPPPNEATKRDRTVGVVVRKEYCYAKKNKNRYRLPRGTRFFRVKVKPLTPEENDMVAQRIMESSSSSGEALTIPPTSECSTSGTEATAAKRSRRKTISDSSNIQSCDQDDSLATLSSCCTSLTIPAPPPINQRLINSINFHSAYQSMSQSANILGLGVSRIQSVVPFSPPRASSVSNLEDEVDNTNNILKTTSDTV